MLRNFVKNVVRQPSLYRWSHTVEDYHPVMPRSRWEVGALPFSRLCEILDQQRDAYNAFLDRLGSNTHLLDGVELEPDPHTPNAPYWNNPWFTCLDAAALLNFIAWKKPKRFAEIGSGHSTRFASYAIRSLGLETIVTSIDPQPREAIDKLCDRILRAPLEECDLAIFDELEAGDILFFDGSHRVFTNSDVAVFFFEVLPRLKSGVIVQIHDIFLPRDYPKDWNWRLYSEQYLLAAMLMCGQPPFRVLAPISFMTHDVALRATVKHLFSTGTRTIPLVNPVSHLSGGSFWIEMRQ